MYLTEGKVRWCVVLAAFLALAACSSQTTGVAGPAPTPSPTTSTVAAQPEDLDAAVAAAQEKVDRHTSGDFAGEWLMFTKDMRDHMTQDAFVEYSKKCSRIGLKVKVSGGRMDGPDRAVVRAEVLGETLSFTMAYENGGWYKVPDEFLTANYGRTGAEMITADTAGECKG